MNDDECTVVKKINENVVFYAFDVRNDIKIIEFPSPPPYPNRTK